VAAIVLLLLNHHAPTPPLPHHNSKPHCCPNCTGLTTRRRTSSGREMAALVLSMARSVVDRSMCGGEASGGRATRLLLPARRLVGPSSSSLHSPELLQLSRAARNRDGAFLLPGTSPTPPASPSLSADLGPEQRRIDLDAVKSTTPPPHPLMLCRCVVVPSSATRFVPHPTRTPPSMAER
jgi:hypothetical protein